MGGLLYYNFYFVVHTACNCMDAIHLNGNEWILYLYATVSNIFLSLSIQREIVWMPLAWVVMNGSMYPTPKVRLWAVRAWPSNRRSRGELDVVTRVFTSYTRFYMKVLNCGLVGMTVYTCLYVYMGMLHMGSMLQYILEYLAFNLETRLSFVYLYYWLVGLKWNSSTGTLTKNAYIEHSWRLAICRESTCYATDIERDCHLMLAICEDE